MLLFIDKFYDSTTAALGSAVEMAAFLLNFEFLLIAAAAASFGVVCQVKTAVTFSAFFDIFFFFIIAHTPSDKGGQMF